MAAQDVRALVPRVRRAIEGPVPLPVSEALSDAQVEALAADCIADIILLTVGQWDHKLLVLERDPASNAPLHWTVDPELSPEDEALIAAQAGVSYWYRILADTKVSERIRNEGVEWEWAKSANLIRDWLKSLLEMRDGALAGAKAANPVMARYASFLEVRDRASAAMLEPWTVPGYAVP